MSLRKVSVALTLLASAWLAEGCSAARFVSPSLEHHPSALTTSHRSLGFLWGLVPPDYMSLDQCGEPGIQRMKVKQDLIDMLITGLTSGVVVSYKVRITCALPLAESTPVKIRPDGPPPAEAP